jgi:hypothetical protein
MYIALQAPTLPALQVHGSFLWPDFTNVTPLQYLVTAVGGWSPLQLACRTDVTPQAMPLKRDGTQQKAAA